MYKGMEFKQVLPTVGKHVRIEAINGVVRVTMIVDGRTKRRTFTDAVEMVRWIETDAKIEVQP